MKERKYIVTSLVSSFFGDVEEVLVTGATLEEALEEVSDNEGVFCKIEEEGLKVVEEE